MKTVILEPGADLQPAAAALKEGQLVAFPTETVYGLGANALNEVAVKSIYEAKGRPQDNPLIVHVAEPGAVASLISELPPIAAELMEQFWPGPLTLVFKRSAKVPAIVSAGLETVAIRMPDHPVALELIRLAGVPIAAPSANISGRPSPTTAEHVYEDLKGKLPFIVDGGATPWGVESTVVDVSGPSPQLLRPGGVTQEELEALLGPLGATESSERPQAPGMKYSHYAPKAELILVTGSLDLVREKIVSLQYAFEEEGKRVGILCTEESKGFYRAPVVLDLGPRSRPVQIAASLFASLRAFDLHGVDVILAEGLPEAGLGRAIMNRLRKAAGGRVVPA